MTESDKHRADVVLRALTRAAAATHDVADRVIAGTGQTLARWQVLDTFASGPATVPSVARRLSQTRQSTQRVADILLNEELVERRENPDHRTSPLFVVTPAGHAILEQSSEEVQPWLDHLGAILSEGEHDVLVNQLLTLYEAASAYRASLDD